MLLSHRTSVKIRPEYSNIIGHMCYAASKLWNVCNYERHHYKELQRRESQTDLCWILAAAREP